MEKGTVSGKSFRCSKYSGNSTVFDGYSVKVMNRYVEENGFDLGYFGVLGEDLLPTPFVANDHFSKRSSERLGASFSEIILGDLVSTAENCLELGNLLADMIYDGDDKNIVVALYIEAVEEFFYLSVNKDGIYVGTVIDERKTYFVSQKSVKCWVKKDGTFVTGIENIPMFKTKQK